MCVCVSGIYVYPRDTTKVVFDNDNDRRNVGINEVLFGRR